MVGASSVVVVLLFGSLVGLGEVGLKELTLLFLALVSPLDAFIDHRLREIQTSEQPR